MEIGSEIVGRKMKEYRAEINWRHSTNYAAAVGDLNPFYLDDRREGGLLAPPTFATALTWPVIRDIYDYIDLGYPPEMLFRMVHYSEHLTFHRPLRPGDRLSITGEVAAVLPERKGTHVVFKFPALDQKGAPVFTEYIGGMLRGVKCRDSGRGAATLPAFFTNPDADGALAPGAPLWEIPLEISRAAPYLYDGCADVHFPIHTSPAFAQSVGLPDIIYHGVGTLAHAVREIINREAGGNPTGVRELRCRFKSMVIPGGTVRVQLLARREGPSAGESIFYFQVLCEAGKPAVSQGLLRAKTA